MLKRIYLGLITLIMSVLLPSVSWAISIPFINEIHYDNISTDVDEAIEIAGSAGIDLSGWSIVLYNGNGGSSYNTRVLSGTIPDLQNGYGTLPFFYSINGIQNGSPDAIALIDPSSMVIQFLSYEGIFTAVDGPASSIISTDIGVYEPSDTPVGYSLQLAGAGRKYSDFSWMSAMLNTFGAINTGQTFTSAQVIPEPVTISLLGLGLLGLAFTRRKITAREKLGTHPIFDK
ncbi:MAG: lamin tail domain-containing protein [Candidatus Omnitrophota bacterium]